MANASLHETAKVLSSRADELLLKLLGGEVKPKNFREELNLLQETLQRSRSVLENLRICGRTKEELMDFIEKLKEGKDDVNNCYVVLSWNSKGLRGHFSKKIINLKNDIVEFCQQEQLRQDMANGIIFRAKAVELLLVVLKMKVKADHFREDLKLLQRTLELLIPQFEDFKIPDLESNSGKVKKLERFVGKLQKGKKIVHECCKVPLWRIWQRYKYNNDIKSLQECIRKFYEQEIQARTQPLDILPLICRDRKRPGRVRSAVNNEELFAVPKLPQGVVGIGVSLGALKIELLRKDVTVIQIYAPAGCGKSMLATMLCHDKEVKDIFKDKIFFVSVSKTPITSKAYPVPEASLTLNILEGLLQEIGSEVPPSYLSEDRTSKQFKFLMRERKSEPLLLVLDNVSDKSIIEKLFSRTEGYKILITSREPSYTNSLEHHSEYLLNALNHQDSMTLFRQTALSQDGNEVCYKPEEEILNEIVKHCEGFPLAIILIAKSLYRQPAEKWENMAKKLFGGSSILDFHVRLREYCASNLVPLDDKLRECFLDLSSFPKDKRIRVSALIDIWCELYDLEKEDYAFVNLLKIASQSLVKLVGSRDTAKEINASIINKLFVTQYGLFRDLAIYQSRQDRKRFIMDTTKKTLPESWKEQEKHYVDAHLVSLYTGEMSLESWYDLQLPGTEVLILNLSANNYALPPFLQKMRKLKVLIIVNSGSTNAKLTNLKTLTELDNLRRIRLEKALIPSFQEITLLRNLRKVSLIMCNFDEAWEKRTTSISTVLPNLVEIDISYCHDLVELPDWICDIISLQTLSVTYCNNFSALPERIGSMTNLDLLRLHACTGLHYLPESIKELQKLRFLDISDCQELRMLPNGMGELRCLKKLDMSGCIELRELPFSADTVTHLEEVICDKDNAHLWESLSSNLTITALHKNNVDWWIG